MFCSQQRTMESTLNLNRKRNLNTGEHIVSELIDYNELFTTSVFDVVSVGLNWFSFQSMQNSRSFIPINNIINNNVQVQRIYNQIH